MRLHKLQRSKMARLPASTPSRSQVLLPRAKIVIESAAAAAVNAIVRPQDGDTLDLAAEVGRSAIAVVAAAAAESVVRLSTSSSGSSKTSARSISRQFLFPWVCCMCQCCRMFAC